MFELANTIVKTVKELASKTPKKDRKIRNTGAVMFGAGAVSALIPPEFTDVVPEPYITIIRGVLMVVGGVFAIIGQSKTESKKEGEPEK